MNTDSPSGSLGFQRSIAATLAVMAALAALDAFFLQSTSATSWAWPVKDPMSLAVLGAGLAAGAAMLVRTAAAHAWEEMRVGFAVTTVFAVLALNVTLRDHLFADADPSGGFAKIVAFFWLALLVMAAVVGGFSLILHLRTWADSGERKAEIPLFIVIPLVAPAAVTAVIGWALYTSAAAHASWLPWAASIRETRLIGALLLASTVGLALAVIERDGRRLAGGAWGAFVIGLVGLLAAVQDHEAFPWTAGRGVGFLLICAAFLAVGAAGLAWDAAMPDAARWERFVHAENGPRAGSKTVEPMADGGLFGPDSVAWRVWAYPTSLVVGFQRAVAIEELDPPLVASVDATRKIRTDPGQRYDHTILYFAAVAFADSRTVVKSSQALMKMHGRNVGVHPESGVAYDANNPDSQLWILVTGWHSVLKAYEMYGPGKLSAADEEEFWAQCAMAAELQTCDPAAVPRNREELHAYYAAMRPKLEASPVAVDTMSYLMDAKNLFPDLPAVLRPGAVVINAVLRAAVIATLPRWMRQETGLDQPASVDRAVAPWVRLAFGVASRSPWLEMRVLRWISPSTPKVVGHVLYGVPARRTRTFTPAQAFAEHGVPTPAAIRAAGAGSDS